MNNKEFIMNICKCGENDTITYKPYQYGRKVISISLNQAIEIIENNIKELEEIGLLTHEQCIYGARNIFKDHILVFE